MFERCRWPAVALLLATAGLVPLGARQGLPPVPVGVEVQARGPVHEAFACLAADPVPTRLVSKRPPAPIDEMPPAEKPAGDVIWISGYWAWDDDRSDYLWVSGLWRSVPPGKQWVAGYWREESDQWQWVPGFWTAAGKQEDQEVTYLPTPPEPPRVAPPPKPVSEDTFFVPGAWAWNGSNYAWRPGYWARVQPGYVWVPDHYRWTPSGTVFIAGYWDLAVARRGILYAPVVIRPEVITVGYVYTPAYAVRDTVIVDALFVRPTTCHYYFGDYYEARYQTLGYQSCVVYSQTRYDSIIVYERYERRSDPNWLSIQINVYNNRVSGIDPRPPAAPITNTTIVQNNITNITMIAPTTTVIQNKNIQVVNIDNSTRLQARAQAQVVQQVSVQRASNEKPLPPGAPRMARKASLSVPKAQPVKPGMVVPKPRTSIPAQPSLAGRGSPERRVAPAAVRNPYPPKPPGGIANTTRVPPRTTPGPGQANPNRPWLSTVPNGRAGQPLTPGQPLRPGALVVPPKGPLPKGPPPKGPPPRRPPPKPPNKDDRDRR